MQRKGSVGRKAEMVKGLEFLEEEDDPECRYLVALNLEDKERNI